MSWWLAIPIVIFALSLRFWTPKTMKGWIFYFVVAVFLLLTYVIAKYTHPS
jgi:hypothetical protein